jgi:hypothetical protein
VAVAAGDHPVHDGPGREPLDGVGSAGADGDDERGHGDQPGDGDGPASRPRPAQPQDRPGEGLAEHREGQDVRRRRAGAAQQAAVEREARREHRQSEQLGDPHEVERREHEAAEEQRRGPDGEGDELVWRDDVLPAAGRERREHGQHAEAGVRRRATAMAVPSVTTSRLRRRPPPG